MKFVYCDGGRAAANYHRPVGDCVARAIAIAAELPYTQVYNGLNVQRERLRQTKHVRGSSARSGVTTPVFRAYLKGLGWHWTPTMQIGSGCRVHLREGELPMGRLIVSLSKHLVAVLDGVIYDTTDPSRQGTRCVYGYFQQADRETSAGSPREGAAFDLGASIDQKRT